MPFEKPRPAHVNEAIKNDNVPALSRMGKKGAEASANAREYNRAREKHDAEIMQFGAAAHEAEILKDVPEKDR